MKLQQKPWYLITGTIFLALLMFGVTFLNDIYLYLSNILLIFLLVCTMPNMLRTITAKTLQTIVTLSSGVAVFSIATSPTLTKFFWIPAILAFSFITIFAYFVLAVNQKQEKKLNHIFVWFAINILAIFSSTWSALTNLSYRKETVFLATLVVIIFAISIIFAKFYAKIISLVTANLLLIFVFLIFVASDMAIFEALSIAAVVNVLAFSLLYLLQISTKKLSTQTQLAFSGTLIAIMGTVLYIFGIFFA